MYFIQNRLFSDSVRVVQFRQALVDLLTRIVLESIFKVTSKSYSNTFLSYTYYSNKSTIRLDFMCYLWRKSSNFFFFHLSSASVTKYPPVLVLSRLHLHFLWNTVVHLPIDYFTSTSQVDKKKKNTSYSTTFTHGHILSLVQCTQLIHLKGAKILSHESKAFIYWLRILLISWFDIISMAVCLPSSRLLVQHKFCV